MSLTECWIDKHTTFSTIRHDELTARRSLADHVALCSSWRQRRRHCRPPSPTQSSDSQSYTQNHHRIHNICQCQRHCADFTPGLSDDIFYVKKTNLSHSSMSTQLHMQMSLCKIHTWQQSSLQLWLDNLQWFYG